MNDEQKQFRIRFAELSAEREASIEERGKVIFDEGEARRKKAEEGMRECASMIELCLVDDLHLIEKADARSWHTQGYGANGYAKAHLEVTAELNCDGIKSEIRIVDTHRPGGMHPMTYCTYGLFVGIHEDDLEIFRYKPPPSLAAAVRKCWKSGANPRVFWPFLPHGYEEANL